MKKALFISNNVIVDPSDKLDELIESAAVKFSHLPHQPCPVNNINPTGGYIILRPKERKLKIYWNRTPAQLWLKRSFCFGRIGLFIDSSPLY